MENGRIVVAADGSTAGELTSSAPIREPERSYRELVENAMSVILRWDTRGTVTFINEYGAGLFGYRREELVGRNVMGTIVDETENTGRDLRLMIQEIGTDPEKYRDNENENMTRDGGRLWMHWRNAAVLDNHGCLVEILSIGNDISGRKKMEEELRSARTRLAFLLSNAPAVIYTCRYGGDWAATFVSDNLRDYLGYEPREVYETDGFWINRVHPEDRQRILDGLRALTSVDVYLHEYRFLHKDGSYRWMYDKISVVRDDRGVPVECVGSWMDITASKEADEMLHLSEARYHSIIEDQTELICRYLPNGRISFVNGAYARYYGKLPKDLLGRNYIPHIPEPDLSLVLGWLGKITADSPIAQFEHRVIMPDGAVRWQQWTHRGIYAPDGSLMECQAVGRDITERRRTDEELEQYRVGLEEMVALRTTELRATVAKLMKEIEHRNDAEKKLERNRLLLNGVFESIQDGIAVLDIDQNIITTNRAVESLFPEHGSLGFKKKTCYEVYRNATERCADCATIRAIKEETPQSEIIPVCREGSGPRWLEAFTFPFWGEQGELRGVIQYLREITGRRMTEEHLQESEQRFRTLFEKAGEGILQMSTDGCVVAVNEAFAEMHGYRVEEMQNMKLSDLDPRFDPLEPDERKLRVSAGETVRFEVEHRHRSGHMFPVEVPACLITLKGESSILSFHRDISARKQAEKELLEKDEKMSAMLESFDGFIYICSPDYRIEFMNENLMRRTGRNAVGETCYSALHERESICPWCVNDRVLRGETVRWEVQSPKDGRWYYIVNTPIRHANGSVSKQAMIVDITEKVRLEKHARINDHLAVLGQLSAGIAHEINNPNTFIMSNAQILQDIWRDADRVLAEHWDQQGDFFLGGLPFSEMRDQVDRVIGYVIKGSERISSIVSGLKAYISPQRGFKSEQLEVNEIIRSACLVLDSRIAEATDNFRMKLDEELPHVLGNRQALEQVVTNLITNALQALRDKTGSVSVSTRGDAEKSEVVIEVDDGGIGMTQEVLHNAMNPFYTTKRDGTGVGLGLAIALSIVNNHDGSLCFESEPGRGTRATVRLPYCGKHSNYSSRTAGAEQHEE